MNCIGPDRAIPRAVAVEVAAVGVGDGADPGAVQGDAPDARPGHAVETDPRAVNGAWIDSILPIAATVFQVSSHRRLGGVHPTDAVT